jgi:hypothetical protein
MNDSRKRTRPHGRNSAPRSDESSRRSRTQRAAPWRRRGRVIVIGSLSGIVRPPRKDRTIERHIALHGTALRLEGDSPAGAGAGASLQAGPGSQLTAGVLFEYRAPLDGRFTQRREQRSGSRRKRGWRRQYRCVPRHGRFRHHPVHARRIPSASSAHAHHGQSLPEHHA